MVWLWKRGLMSSSVKCWCLLLVHRWSRPWSRERGVSAGAVASLQVQACWDHPWKKMGDEKRKGRMGWAHLPTHQLPASCSHLHKQTRKRLCPWFENEVAEDCTCHTDVSWARAAQCGHGAMVGVGGMALCRKSCRSGLAGVAEGVARAAGLAQAPWVCVGSIFRVMAWWREPAGHGNSQQRDRPGDGVMLGSVSNAIASLWSDKNFLA